MNYHAASCHALGIGGSPFPLSLASHGFGCMEVNHSMGVWEGFLDDWRVYCLLESVTASERSTPRPAGEPVLPLSMGCHLGPTM